MHSFQVMHLFDASEGRERLKEEERRMEWEEKER